jgi:hypothetical protein
MHKKYVLKLSAEERAELQQVVRKGKAAAWKVQRAQALLKFDQGNDAPGWTDERIAEAFGCTSRVWSLGGSRRSNGVRCRFWSVKRERHPHERPSWTGRRRPG